MTQYRSLTALLFALVILLAGCKGESPTAPPPSNGGGGTTNPPTTGVGVTLTASNTNPVVDSVVVITAQVTQNGQPAPDGTAVEFASTGGSFAADGTVTSLLRTTTNGVATVSLRSSTAGLIRVQAAVANVSRTVDVTYKVQTTQPPPVSTAPTITGVTPTLGLPTGGERIRITGTNFRAPVRVLFDTGGAQPIEAFVVSVTETAIEVLTPSVNVGVGQQLVGDVIVLTQAGTATEQRVELEDGFTFRNETLTPRVSTATPNSGPVTGGTRVTIFGDGFQAPVQVLFGSAEARVITVEYSQIIVEAPSARDTSPTGSGPITGPVGITVRNINSQTSTSLDAGFRYTAAVQITSIAPSEGPFTGGTRVTIDGNGFVAPVAVTIAGFVAQPISVTGTKIVAITTAIQLEDCGDVTDVVSVTNIVNGDTAEGPDFTYRVPPPSIVSINPASTTPGSAVTIVVANAPGGITRFTIGGRTLFPTSAVFNGDGSATFTVVLPLDFDFPTETCPGDNAGEREVAIRSDVTYLNVNTGCDDTATQALTINPPFTGCVTPPPADVGILTPPAGTCVNAGNVSVTDPATGTGTITIRNNGQQPLDVVLAGIAGANAGDFTITPAFLSIDPAQVGQFTVTFNPSAPPGAKTATANFTSNDPDASEAAFSICLEGNGTP